VKSNGVNNARLSKCKTFSNLRLLQFLPLNRINSISLRDASLSLSLFLFADPSSAPYVLLSRLRATVLPTSRHRDIKIGCHYSLTQFFFNLPRPFAVCVISTYLSMCVCVSLYIQPSKPLRRRAVSSSRPISASSLRFPRLVFILPRARNGYVSRHERDSQAFMRISIYSGALRVFFLDDEGRALLTTITARLMKRSACA